MASYLHASAGGRLAPSKILRQIAMACPSINRTNSRVSKRDIAKQTTGSGQKDSLQTAAQFLDMDCLDSNASKRRIGVAASRKTESAESGIQRRTDLGDV
jgi:hypothetical protein